MKYVGRYRYGYHGLITNKCLLNSGTNYGGSYSRPEDNPVLTSSRSKCVSWPHGDVLV